MTRPIAVVDSSAELGGAELSLLPVVRSLLERRPVVAFLPAHGPLEQRLVALGARVVPGFAIPGAAAKASRHYGVGRLLPLGLASLVQQARLTAALSRVRPAAVYCNGFRAQLGATMPASLVRAPAIWHVRDFVPTGAAGAVWTLLARRTNAIVANSSATATQPALPRPALVIWNGIDLRQFRPRKAIPPGPPLLGMVGHLTPWKGHLRFLRVLEAVRVRIPELRGSIAGGPIYETSGHGSYPARLKSALRTHDLEQLCSVTWVKPESMHEFLAELTVLVHCPDRPEPFGRSLAEAMAVGIPIVASAGNGAAEVVDGVATICPLGDDQAIEEAVVDLLADPAQREERARAGIARAQALFDEDEYGRRVADVVLECAGGREG